MVVTADNWSAALRDVPDTMRCAIVKDEPMSRHTTLRVGGAADLYYRATDTWALAELVVLAQKRRLTHYVIGDGSNVCVSDSGVRGLVIQNACRKVRLGATTTADAGCNFMGMFVDTMQAGLSGLEWAVGIPGTLGGALVSNAGAYGGNIVDVVDSIDVVENGERKTVGQDWMEFSYRDSRLRRDRSRPAVLLGCTLNMKREAKYDIRRRAKDIQRQRILKQPWEPSAGSFFKNIHNLDLAQGIEGLPALMRERGVVTSAFLIDQAGCKGLQIGGAAISPRHANFVVNRGGATAADIRLLVDTVRARVAAKYAIELEEEVLYVGEW